jgi:formate hydrogenlyase subunit 3/multisubunit Na+/H+ antiporter MnhD subunit
LLAPALLIGLCILLGLYAVPLVEAATIAVQRLSDPNIYIVSVLGGS